MAKLNTILLSILLIVSLSSLSQALILNGLHIGYVEIRGILRCTLSGDLTAPPISGQTVVIRCAGSTTTLGTAVTDVSGAFVVVTKILDTVLFDPSTCLATVKLPVGTCSVIPPDSLMGASISLVNVIQSVLGNIAEFTTGLFKTL